MTLKVGQTTVVQLAMEIEARHFLAQFGHQSVVVIIGIEAHFEGFPFGMLPLDGADIVYLDLDLN